MTGNFHQISYIDRLYLQRKNGGRALKCITTYEARIAADIYHLLPQRSKYIYIVCFINREENKLVRVGREFLESKDIDDNEN